MNHLTRFILGLVAIVFMAGTVPAQFDSGSTGADGPLLYPINPSARGSHAMAYDSDRNRVVVFSGSHENRETWEWGGMPPTWTRISTPVSPMGRTDSAMVYDANRVGGGRIVLFGGSASFGLLDETWEYDGANWTSITTVNKPPAVNSHAMVYDSVRGLTVLFTGNAAGSSTTWEYDGDNWTLVSSPGLDIRAGFGMAYDSLREKVVLFSGTGAGGGINDLTYEYDPATNTWSLVSPLVKPPGRSNFNMIFDTTINRTVVFSGTTAHADTWQYDGTTWTDVSSTPSPSARHSHRMVFDGTRTILFGGYQAGNIPASDTWRLQGTTWTRLSTDSHVFDMSAKSDGVWNFEGIFIPPNATITFLKNTSNTPVIWLASGDVNIQGTIDVRGVDGTASVTPGTESPGGPGGFAGGLGGRNESASGSFAGMAGQGPGGGNPGTTSGQRGGNAGHATTGPDNSSGSPSGGAAYGNRFLRPLIAGSGGGGSASTSSTDGRSGSGGGGAIRIASSGDIQLTGSILALGGSGANPSAGSGSGGAIHLIANRIEGTGTANAKAGSVDFGGGTSAADGRVRFEGFFVANTFAVTGSYSFGPPSSIDLTNQGTIVIKTVAGVNVASPPGGLLVSPDVVFSDDGEIVVGLQTNNIPEGTIITVQVSTAGDQILANSTPVNGSGEATANMTVPAGVGVIQAWAAY